MPGYDSTMARHKTPMTSLERSLYKLNAVRELGDWAKNFIDPDAEIEDDGSDGNMGKPIQLVEDEIWEKGLDELESGEQFDPDDIFHEENNQTPLIESSWLEESDDESDEDASANFYSSPCVTSMPSSTVLKNGNPIPVRRDSVIVIIRHGKTEHNKLGLFTGWEDAPLAMEGIEEAKEAGRLLKEHGFEFDVVYTSWLSRALETAWYVMDEMDQVWLPIIKTW